MPCADAAKLACCLRLLSGSRRSIFLKQLVYSGPELGQVFRTCHSLQVGVARTASSVGRTGVSWPPLPSPPHSPAFPGRLQQDLRPGLGLVQSLGLAATTRVGSMLVRLGCCTHQLGLMSADMRQPQLPCGRSSTGRNACSDRHRS